MKKLKIIVDGLMLIGLHIGLHYNSMCKLKRENKILLNVFLCLVGLIFGIQGFIKREFINKITLQNLYPIYEDNLVMLFIDYIGILIMFIMVGYGFYNILNLKKERKKIDE